MKSSPVFVSTARPRIVILGGSEQDAHKARLPLKTDATLVMTAADLDEELAVLVASGRAQNLAGPVTVDFL